MAGTLAQLRQQGFSPRPGPMTGGPVQVPAGSQLHELGTPIPCEQAGARNRHVGIIAGRSQDGGEGQRASRNGPEGPKKLQPIRTLHVHRCGKQGTVYRANLPGSPVGNGNAPEGMPHQDRRFPTAGDRLVQGRDPILADRLLPAGHLHPTGFRPLRLPDALPVAGARTLVARNKQERLHGPPITWCLHENPKPNWIQDRRAGFAGTSASARRRT